MKRKINYIVTNSVFVAALYFGIYKGIDGAENIALFMAWFAIVISFFTFHDDLAKSMQEKGPSVPRYVDIGFDIIVASYLLWFDYTLTGSLYVVHTILICGAYSREIKGETS